MDAPARRTALHRASRTVALGAVLVAIVPGQAAAATWSPAVTISNETTQNDHPSIGFGSDGIGLAAWQTVTCGHGHSCVGRIPSRGRSARRGLDGRFERQRALPFGGELEVYGRHGAALFGGRTVALGSIGGTFGRQQRFPALIAAHAVNAHGQMAVVGLRNDANAPSRLRLAERHKGGRFGAMRAIKGGTNATDADIALNGRGDLAIAYVHAGHVLARRRRAGRPFGPAFRIGRASANGTRVQVALSERGAVWVLWQNRVRDADAGPFHMRLATQAAGAHGFRDDRLLDARAEMPLDDHRSPSFSLVLDPAGTAYAAWSGFDGTAIRAQLATIDASGVTVTMQSLSAATYNAGVTGAAAGADPGRALVTWTRLRPDPGIPPDLLIGDPEQIMAALIEPGRPFAGEEAVTPIGAVSPPVGAIDPRTGVPTVVWSVLTGPIPFTSTTRREVVRAATRIAP